ncbi:MAG: hypothetical protein EHM47_14135, partial [Ignavibacteriales bacterium]
MKNKKNKNYTRRKFIEQISISAAAVPFINSSILSESSQKIYTEIEFIRNTALPEKPNIIFILSDDHRYDFMSFMLKEGGAINTPEFLETPGMDKIAEEGAHIKNAFVTTALCSPSRASVLTGMYSHTHGVIDNDSPVPPHNIFFPEYLQKAGYETGFIGKWHMGSANDEPRKGFDKWISFKGQGVYNDPLLNLDGREVQREGYITDILTEYAVNFLKERKSAEEKNKPFFLYLSHKAVHAEFIPAERYKGKYAEEKIVYPDTMENTKENYKDKPDWVNEQRYGWHGVDYMYHGELKEDFDGFYKRYCETLLALDEGIGTVLNTLAETGLDKSTIVFYMG